MTIYPVCGRYYALQERKNKQGGFIASGRTREEAITNCIKAVYLNNPVLVKSPITK